jgi:hypothetical protein
MHYSPRSSRSHAHAVTPTYEVSRRLHALGKVTSCDLTAYVIASSSKGALNAEKLSSFPQIAREKYGRSYDELDTNEKRSVAGVLVCPAAQL